MHKGLFISATSTGIGKTLVSSILCYKLMLNNYKTAYYKPVQSGIIIDEFNNKISGDCKFIQTVMKNFQDFKTYTSYLLNTPASPHYSARLDGININPDKIMTDFKKIRNENNVIIVEGAGGLYVPYNENGGMLAEIPLKLHINCVLVGNAGLGTLNHVLLSCFYARSIKLNISAVILISYEDGPTEIELENLKILKKLLNNTSIFIIPAVKNTDTEKNQPGDIFDKINFFPDINEIISWI